MLLTKRPGVRMNYNLISGKYTFQALFLFWESCKKNERDQIGLPLFTGPKGVKNNVTNQLPIKHYDFKPFLPLPIAIGTKKGEWLEMPLIPFRVRAKQVHFKTILISYKIIKLVVLLVKRC